jgi:hypothetical protein
MMMSKTLFKYTNGFIDESEYIWTATIINARKREIDFKSNPVTCLKLSVIGANGKRHFAQFPLEQERPLGLKDLAKLILLTERKLHFEVDVDDELRALMDEVAGESKIG